MDDRDLDERLGDAMGQLRVFARRLAPDASSAEDLLQDAVERAWSRRGSFGGEARLTTWIYRSMVNRAIDLARNRQRRTLSPQFDPWRRWTSDGTGWRVRSRCVRPWCGSRPWTAPCS